MLCTRAPDSFAAAREDRVRVSGKPSQYDDLDAFVREQDLFRRCLGESLLPSMETDVSDGDVARAAGGIADRLEATGGLHLP